MMEENERVQDWTFKQALKRRIQKDYQIGIRQVSKGRMRRLIAVSLASGDIKKEELEKIVDKIANIKEDDE